MIGGMKYTSVLRPASYQLVPLLKLIYNDLNCVLISDGVGVGKTISACYALVFLSNYLNQSGVVISPPSLLNKWKQELETKFFFKAIIVTKIEEFATMEYELQNKRNKKINMVYIIPNSLLSKIKLNDKINVSVIIFDEIHSFRNNNTIGYHAARNISKHAKFRIGLSATPINNNLNDLISEFSILLTQYNREVISSMIEDLWTRNKDKITNPLVTRFTKENLGIHFASRDINSYHIIYPPKYIQRVKEIVSNISSSKNTFFEKVVYYRLAASSTEAFRKSIGISERLIDSDPKISALEQILNNNKLNKWIIFCEFAETVKSLEHYFSNNWDIYVMTGDTPLFERQFIIDQFRLTSKSLLIMTPVGSEGLDIQFCHGVINYDLHWNPMKIEQRIGRIDRIGQKKNQVFVINMIVDGSIDERVLKVIERKLLLISNSVFKIMPLIDSKSFHTENIFDNETFETESSKSKKLLKSLKYWESIPSHDYSILSKINVKYCSIRKLMDLAQKKKIELLMNDDNLTKKWLAKIQKDSFIIQNRINFYS